MKQPTLELKELPVNAMYKELGIQVDFSFKIYADDTEIGHIHISILDGDAIYLEWVQIYPKYQGKRYFRHVLVALMDYFGNEVVYFEAPEERMDMYLHLGAEVIAPHSLWRNTAMKLKRKTLVRQSEVKRKIRELSEQEKEIYINNRQFLFEQLIQLNADLAGMAEQELVFCRSSLMERVDGCLSAILETDADNMEF